MNTTALTNGTATLTAVAYDQAGNKGSSSPVAVTIANNSTTNTTSTTTTGSSTSTTTASGSTSSSTTTVSNTASTIGSCLPPGSGTDYQVGPNAGQLATLDLVPWDKLVAGDTVRIFYSATPYRGKFMLSGNGTAAAPIRVCGVRGPNGERPIIDCQNITIADNVIHDCTNGTFSKSTNDEDFAVTKNILISGNYIYGNGVVGDVHEHNTYTESVNITYEFNRFEHLRAGALGNAIKDRSAGTVIRYNYVGGGAHSMDLVEAEDFYAFLSTVPAHLSAYRSAFVYGNIIVKDGSTGSAIHYGGDHYGSTPDSG